jgi:hypothetical protein
MPEILQMNPTGGQDIRPCRNRATVVMCINQFDLGQCREDEEALIAAEYGVCSRQLSLSHHQLGTHLRTVFFLMRSPPKDHEITA